MLLLLKFIKLNWQGIIALLALGISIRQGCQIRRHNKLSVRPHLTQRTYREAKKGFYRIELINIGLVPARIKEFFVKVDGKLIARLGTEPIENGLR